MTHTIQGGGAIISIQQVDAVQRERRMVMEKGVQKARTIRVHAIESTAQSQQRRSTQSFAIA